MVNKFEIPPEQPGLDAATRLKQEEQRFTFDHNKNKLQHEKFMMTIEKITTPNFYCFVLIMIYIIGFMIYCFKKDNVVDVKDFLLPIITTYLGYTIGKDKD